LLKRILHVFKEKNITKTMDTDLLWFYVRMWDLRVTDLMQGPVYGIFTHENQHDERLLPCFSYDELFGTQATL